MIQTFMSSKHFRNVVPFCKSQTLSASSDSSKQILAFPHPKEHILLLIQYVIFVFSFFIKLLETHSAERKL